jgi:hypothetical protein
MITGTITHVFEAVDKEYDIKSLVSVIALNGDGDRYYSVIESYGKETDYNVVTTISDEYDRELLSQDENHYSWNDLEQFLDITIINKEEGDIMVAEAADYPLTLN